MRRDWKTLAVAFTALLGILLVVGCSVERENDQVTIEGVVGPCEPENRVVLVVECDKGGEVFCTNKKVAVLYAESSTDINGICGTSSGFCINVVVNGPAVLMAMKEQSFEDFQLTFEVMDDVQTLEDEHQAPVTAAVFEVSAPAEILVTVP